MARLSRKHIEHEAGELLRKNKLSITESRVRILHLFLEKRGALSHSDIENSSGNRFDRVTVYRTLQVFEDKGIIHTIPTSDNSIQYALCKEDCAGGHHHDHHIHFLCKKCQITYCLDEVVTPDLKLPGGYTADQVEVVVEGVCRNCSK